MCWLLPAGADLIRPRSAIQACLVGSDLLLQVVHGDAFEFGCFALLDAEQLPLHAGGGSISKQPLHQGRTREYGSPADFSQRWISV